MHSGMTTTIGKERGWGRCREETGAFDLCGCGEWHCGHAKASLSEPTSLSWLLGDDLGFIGLVKDKHNAKFISNKRELMRNFCGANNNYHVPVCLQRAAIRASRCCVEAEQRIFGQ